MVGGQASSSLQEALSYAKKGQIGLSKEVVPFFPPGEIGELLAQGGARLYPNQVQDRIANTEG